MARTTKENVRERILEAAEKRLWYFGIKKTTIDEIATDAAVGKGTVYLYFSSKEEIAIAIMGKYKAATVERQAAIAADMELSALEKLRQMLKLPIMNAHRTCEEHPQALEVVVAVKPHLAERLQPHLCREIELIADVLASGSQKGNFEIQDPVAAATTLKMMTLGFLPPYPCITGTDKIETALDKIVEMAYRGFASKERQLSDDTPNDLRIH